MGGLRRPSALLEIPRLNACTDFECPADQMTYADGGCLHSPSKSNHFRSGEICNRYLGEQPRFVFIKMTTERRHADTLAASPGHCVRLTHFSEESLQVTPPLPTSFPCFGTQDAKGMQKGSTDFFGQPISLKHHPGRYSKMKRLSTFVFLLMDLVAFGMLMFALSQR